MDQTQKSHDYQRIEKAIRYIEDHARTRPSLDEIAAYVHTSKYHFHKLFKRWAGITPAQFLQTVSLGHAKEKLLEGRCLLETTLETGLSSPGRLHDLFVTLEAVSPGEYKNKGEGLQIHYGIHPTPFGQCLVGLTPRGICHLSFFANANLHLGCLKADWPHAILTCDPAKTAPYVDRLFHHAKGALPTQLLVKGTNFQVQVWRALLQIPVGSLVCYQDFASFLGHPEATRAVANAIAANPIAYLIPCHRVITKSGHMHRYRWGTCRKKAIHTWESGIS